ncbi:hypothetical protein N0V82_005190 [Gnomoniopsis sp. IMI 355080]|nr:hypothetical protein N0V82_005190 [Gnomoniopsis sp. IMI 355080]
MAHNPINPEQRCFIKFVEHVYRKHLIAGPTMRKMREVFKASVNEDLRLENLTWCMEGDETSFSLHTLVRHIVVEGATKSLFGTHLHDIDHRVVEHMLDFNDNVWQLVMRYPDFPFYPSAVSAPLEKLLAIMRKFVAVPARNYSQINLLIRHTLIGMENTALDIDSRARMMLMMFWASVSNEHNSTFWLLTHILYDEELLQLVEREVEEAWQSGDLDFRQLSEKCPNLDAAFHEVLRVKNAAGSMRMVNQEMTLGGKAIRPGNVIHIPFRQLHTNENVWGDQALEFDHSRFLKQKSLTRNPSYKPFGGGESYCPGRTLAKHEVFTVVATLLHRFKVRLSGNGENRQPFPIMNDKTPSLGLNGPIDGMDIIINLCARKSFTA